MQELIKQSVEHVAFGIELVAIIIVTIGTLEAVAAAVRMLVTGRSDTARRGAMLKYARWLAAGLTFQLAGDIVHTSIAPTWDDIGRLAAIAVIRTFLTFFLERDIKDWREQLARSEHRPKRGDEVVPESS
jgi:uncharacterized membrane protein